MSRGPGDAVCCTCGVSLNGKVYYGAGDGTRTGQDGFFQCEICHKCQHEWANTPFAGGQYCRICLQTRNVK